MQQMLLISQNQTGNSALFATIFVWSASYFWSIWEFLTIGDWPILHFFYSMKNLHAQILNPLILIYVLKLRLFICLFVSTISTITVLQPIESSHHVISLRNRNLHVSFLRVFPSHSMYYTVYFYFWFIFLFEISCANWTDCFLFAGS